MAILAASFTDIGTEVWVLGLVAVLVSAGTGFGSGIYYSRLMDNRKFRQARTGVTRLFETVVSALDSAQQVCALLEKYEGRFLMPEQTDRLMKKRNSLLETVTGVVKRHGVATEAESEDAPKSSKKPVSLFKVDFQTEPTDPPTGLPNRNSFDVNLENLLRTGRDAYRESGLVFVKIDKLESLRSKHSAGDLDKLIKKLTTLVCRSVRDQDLVCRYSPDTLAILLPGSEAAEGRNVAGKIRDSIRSFQFRVEDHSPEIFMTASFGYTACGPEDNAPLVVNRCADAVMKSQQRGRNQLHAHDGKSLQHCLAG